MERATLDQATKILGYFRDQPKEQIQAILASGLLADIRDANFNKLIDRNAVRELLGLRSLNLSLSKSISAVTIPASTEPFVVSEHFVLGGASRIVFVNYQLKMWFLGKTEEPIEEMELRCAKPIRPSPDGPILSEIADRAKVMLFHVYALMLRQPNGEEGILSTNGWANVFYIPDNNGVPRAVGVSWGNNGWLVLAYSVEEPGVWHGDCRVFFRAS